MWTTAGRSTSSTSYEETTNFTIVLIVIFWQEAGSPRACEDAPAGTSTGARSLPNLL